MKKQIKKTAACLLSMLMLQSMAVLPASAATATTADVSSGTNFETNCGYTVGTNNFLVGKAFYVKAGALNKTATTVDGKTTYTTEGISIVDDPAPLYPGDKAFKVKGGEKNTNGTAIWPQLFSYGSATPNVKVWEFDVMFTENVNNFVMSFQVKKYLNKKESIHRAVQPIGTNVKDGKTMWVTDGLPSETNRKAEVSLNEWHHVKIIADFRSSTKVTDTWEDDNGATQTKDKYVIGADSTYTTLFDDVVVNKDVKISDKDVNFDGNTVFDFAYISRPDNNNGDVYLDNYRFYTLADTDTTTFEMKSYEDYANNSYMNGTNFKFYADSIMGSDTVEYPINKVVWYLDGEDEGTTTTKYPFNFECSPKVAGKHTVSCEAYTDADTEPLEGTYQEMSFYVEPKFIEDVVISEDFNDYVDGTLSWNDDMGGGSWLVRNVQDASTVVGVNVDEEHGKSLYLGTTKTRRLDGNVTPTITDGTVKVSGEIYLDGVIGNNNTMFTLMMWKDVSSFNLHNGKTLQNRQVSDTNAALGEKLVDKKWYKLDWIVTIKEGQAYYTAYIDGRQVAHGGYNSQETKIASVFKGAMFAAFSSNVDEGLTGKLYLDNLSISKIEYKDTTGIYSGENTITKLAQMTGTVLMAKTDVVSPEENQQYMAVYDKTSGKLLAVETGTYDSTTKVYTVSYDLQDILKDMDIENIYVKVFVWDSMKPNLAKAIVIE